MLSHSLGFSHMDFIVQAASDNPLILTRLCCRNHFTLFHSEKRSSDANQHADLLPMI